MKEVEITADGDSREIALPQGEFVLEAASTDWGGATATLKRYVSNDLSYTIQDDAGDIVFSENAGVIVPGNGVYFLSVTGYSNPIIFKASQI